MVLNGEIINMRLAKVSSPLHFHRMDEPKEIRLEHVRMPISADISRAALVGICQVALARDVVRLVSVEVRAWEDLLVERHLLDWNWRVRVVEKRKFLRNRRFSPRSLQHVILRIIFGRWWNFCRPHFLEALAFQELWFVSITRPHQLINARWQIVEYFALILDGLHRIMALDGSHVTLNSEALIIPEFSHLPFTDFLEMVFQAVNVRWELPCRRLLHQRAIQGLRRSTRAWVAWWFWSQSSDNLLRLGGWKFEVKSFVRTLPMICDANLILFSLACYTCEHHQRFGKQKNKILYAQIYPEIWICNHTISCARKSAIWCQTDSFWSEFLRKIRQREAQIGNSIHFSANNQIDSTRRHQQGKRHRPRHDFVDLSQRMNIAGQIAPRCVHDDDDANEKFKILLSSTPKTFFLSSFNAHLTINFHTTKLNLPREIFVFLSDERTQSSEPSTNNADVSRMAMHEWKYCL